MAQNVFFKKGLLANLPESYAAGTFYVTTDERAMYLDIDDSTRIRLGDFIQVDAVANLPTAGASTSALYYCVSENVLAKWNGSAWTQINKQPTAEEMKTLLGLGSMAYKSTVVEGDLSTELVKKINDASAAHHGHDNKDVIDGITSEKVAAWDGAVSKEHTHSFSDEAALNSITTAKIADWDDAVSKEHTHTFTDTDVEDAISKKHSHTFVESELNKIVAGDVAKWNGVVADHLTSADKTAIEDSIGDVNTSLENYKTSNNEALAGVKATADAAAVKTEVESALSGKVDKVEGKSLISDSEITRLATLHNYDDTQVKADIAKKADSETMTTELGKKVDKVDGKDLISTSEIERLATLKNYDDTAITGRVTTAEGKITDLETASAKHALKTELEAVDKKFEDYTKTADLPTDLGDFTNNAGYAKTADVNVELDKKADKTQVATDIANAIAPLATTEALNGVDAKFTNYTNTTDMNAKFDLKADKTQVATDIANAIAPLATTEALNGVKEIAEAARTESEVDGQIDAKITALNLGTTYEPIGAEQRAKDYVDGKFTDANLDQYTTEQEVKDIVDTVISGAVDGDTITGLANLVEYLNTHGVEAKEMGAAIDVLEGKVETIEGKPGYGITATQISNWDGEVGAKALAETKLDASTFTEYSNTHAGDYTNKQIDDAIDADVKNAIDAEILRANGAYDAKGTASSAVSAARTEITTEIGTAISSEVSRADGKYEEKGVAQGIVDGLKLTETYEPIGAETRAIAAAEGKVNALASNVYTKSEVYTKTEVESLMSWGEF